MTTPTHVSRDDIEAKLREIRDETERTTESAKPKILAAAAVGGLVILALVYMAGRRRGRKGRTVVEVRRL